MMIKLSKMKEIDIRKVWPHEQYSFSKWLANEENIEELSNILHLSLSEIELEKNIGNYRCDICCKDEISGKIVLIENQLEPSNHEHLGKLLTYASGIGATIIIWLVADTHDEHAEAIRWLNRYTNEDIDFFLVEIHAYQIDNSEIAPQFQIIEKPYGFAKGNKSSETNELNETQRNCLNFWSKFNDILIERGRPIPVRKATSSCWYNIAMGSSVCHLSVDLINKENRIRIGLWINDDKEKFDDLLLHRDEIEEKTNIKYEWNRMDDRKTSTVCCYISDFGFDNQNNYNDLINEIIDKIIVIKEVFKEHI